jgi:hypothetical protein
MIRCALARLRACAGVAVLVFAVGCNEDSPATEPAQRQVCRQLMEHIIQVTPRPGSDRPETDPARVKEIAAKIPIEDIDLCAVVKDPVKKGEPPPPEGQTPRVIACMQAAKDPAELRACIPAKTD